MGNTTRVLYMIRAGLIWGIAAEVRSDLIIEICLVTHKSSFISLNLVLCPKFWDFFKGNERYYSCKTNLPTQSWI